MKKLVMTMGVLSCLAFGILEGMVPVPRIQQGQQNKNDEFIKQVQMCVASYDRQRGTNYSSGLLLGENKITHLEQLFVWCLNNDLNLGLYVLSNVFDDDIFRFDLTLLTMYAYATGNLDVIRQIESISVREEGEGEKKKYIKFEIDVTALRPFVAPDGKLYNCNILLPAAIGGLESLQYLSIQTGADIFSATNCPDIDSIVRAFFVYNQEDSLVYFMEQEYADLLAGERGLEDCKCLTYRNNKWTTLSLILAHKFPNALRSFMTVVEHLPEEGQGDFLKKYSTGDCGRNPLHIVANDSDSMRFLSLHRPDLLGKFAELGFLEGLDETLCDDEDYGPNTPWKIFLAERDYEKIQPILPYILSDEFSEFQKFTEIHKLVLLGNTQDLLDFLTENPEADINAVDVNDCDPFYLAVKFGLTDIVQTLLGVEGIKLHTHHGGRDRTPIEVAIQSGNISIVNMLLSNEYFVEQYMDDQDNYLGDFLVTEAVETENIEILRLLLDSPIIPLDVEAVNSIIECGVRYGNWEPLSLLLQRDGINIFTQNQYSTFILRDVLNQLAIVFFKNTDVFIKIFRSTYEMLSMLGTYCKEASFLPNDTAMLLEAVIDELKGVSPKGAAECFILSVLTHMYSNDEIDRVPMLDNFISLIDELPSGMQAKFLLEIYGCTGSVNKLIPMMDFLQYVVQDKPSEMEIDFSQHVKNKPSEKKLPAVLHCLYDRPEAEQFLPNIDELLIFLQQSGYSISVQCRAIHIVNNIKRLKADEVIDFLTSNNPKLDPRIWLFVLYKCGGYNNHSELIPAINDFIPLIQNDNPDDQKYMIGFLKALYKKPELSNHLCEVPFLLQAMKGVGLDIETQLDILNTVYKPSGKFAELLPDGNNFNQLVENLDYNKLEYLRLLKCLYGLQALIAEGIPPIFDLIEFMQQEGYDLEKQLNVFREFYVHPDNIEETQEYIPPVIELMQFMIELGYDQQSQIDILRVLYAGREMDASQLLDVIPFMREKEYNLEIQLKIISILFSFSDPNDLIEFIRLTGYASEVKQIFEDFGLKDFYNAHKGTIAYLLRQ